jgi:hypothetical protein
MKAYDMAPVAVPAMLASALYDYVSGWLSIVNPAVFQVQQGNVAMKGE